MRRRLAAVESELAERLAENDWLRRELLAERVRSHQLFDTSPLAYVVTDRHGTLRQVNNAAATLFDRSRSFLTGKPLAVVVPLEERRRFRLLLLSLARRSAPGRTVLSFQRRDGEIIPLTVRVAVGHGPAGEIDWIRWLFQPLRRADRETADGEDLTEVLEELVRERTVELTTVAREADHRHRVLEEVVEQMPFAVLIVDASTREATIANDAFHKLIGPPSARGLFRDASGEVVPDEELPLARSLRSRERVTSVPLAIHRPNGQVVRLEASSAPVIANGQTVAAVATYVDVAARGRRERAEREFVANAAHGIQNPLTVIATAVEILQSGAKDDQEERDRF